MLGAQVLLVLVLRSAGMGADSASAARALIVALALAAFLYLVAGVSQALATERDAVGVRAVLRSGKESFAPFLWLVVKLALLVGIAANVAVFFLAVGDAQQQRTSVEPLLHALPLLEGISGFVFVYWLPIVFVRRRFVLLPTLRAALLTAWRRLSQAAYLAFLTLVPGVAATLVGDSTPLVWVLGVSVVGGFMEWMAFDYCVQWLREQRASVNH